MSKSDLRQLRDDLAAVMDIHGINKWIVVAESDDNRLTTTVMPNTQSTAVSLGLLSLGMIQGSAQVTNSMVLVGRVSHSNESTEAEAKAEADNTHADAESESTK